MNDIITLAHGSGGKITHQLITNLFHQYFANDLLLESGDSAILQIPKGKVAFTTDSFVVSPLFFKGGDIGKLSVCGTVNDIAVCGAKPLYLSCGFIIEEGFLIADLTRIVESMAETAKKAGVYIVTGDTKVVQKGGADQLFINTSGVGIIEERIHISSKNILKGDKIILSGPMADHGTAILLERENLHIESSIKSDCAPLNFLIQPIIKKYLDAIHMMRDPTRGGVATTLNEMLMEQSFSMKLYEEVLPVRDEVKGLCEMLGLDPLYMANEGKVIMVVDKRKAADILDDMKKHPLGKDAVIIGEVIEDQKGRLLIETVTGGTRVVDMLMGDQLPRIC